MEQDNTSGLLSINVWLAGRSYRIRIRPDEEEMVRKAVKLADEKVMEMRRHYAARDDQDFVAMVLLMYAADSATGEEYSPLLKQSLVDMAAKIDRAMDEP